MDEATRANIEAIARNAADAMFTEDAQAEVERAILEATHKGVFGGAKMIREYSDAELNEGVLIAIGWISAGTNEGNAHISSETRLRLAALSRRLQANGSDNSRRTEADEAS